MANYITFVYGRKGSGKSTDDAVNGINQFKKYKASEKYGMPKRLYFSKQKFSEEIEEKQLIGFIRKDGVPMPGGHLAYWENVTDLEFCPRPKLLGYCWRGTTPHHLHHTDIAWDEIGNDLPPDGWKDNPPWLRQVFSHARKRKNKIFANAQRYDMTDIHFRRQVDIVFEVRRFMGTNDDPLLPPVKNPWLIQRKYKIHPDDIKKDDADTAPTVDAWKFWEGWKCYGKMIWGLWPFTEKNAFKIFDTEFERPPYQALRLREVIQKCIEGENCKDPKHGTIIKHVIC